MSRTCGTSKQVLRKRIRTERFKDHLDSENSKDVILGSTGHTANSKGRVVGISTKLEKPYLRLTSEPNPWTIRPLRILKLALENVKAKYLSAENDANVGVDACYKDFACEQMKSIRQDITVQGISNRFAAHVYETHARMALECGDLEEYNQCQSRLLEFRSCNRQQLALANKMTVSTNNAHTVSPALIPICEDEFDGYKQIYILMRKNKLELIGSLRSLHLTHYKTSPIATDGDSDNMVKYALSIINAVSTANFNRFMKLYQHAPLMSGYLIDYMVNRVRFQLLIRLCKAYGSSNVSLESIMQQLHYRSIRECYQYVFLDLECVMYDDAAVGTKRPLSQNSILNVKNYSMEQYKSMIVDCKNSFNILTAKLSNNSNLIVY